MDKVKAKIMADKAKKVTDDAARWVEISKSEKLLAKEKDAIETRLRLHVNETGEVLFGDLMMAYSKAAAAKIDAVGDAKDGKERLQ